MAVLNCPTCHGSMKKTTMSSGNFTGIIIALIVLIMGIVITIAIPIIGWVIGPLMVLLSLGMGGKRQKIWRCRSCRTYVPRV